MALWSHAIGSTEEEAHRHSHRTQADNCNLGLWVITSGRCMSRKTEDLVNRSLIIFSGHERLLQDPHLTQRNSRHDKKANCHENIPH